MTPRFKQTIHIKKTAPHPEIHIFPPILTIFELVHDINKTNILTKFHDREKIGHKSAGRTEGRTDGQRQNNIPPPMAGNNKIKINNRHIMFKLKKSVPQFGLFERTEQKCHYLCKSHTVLVYG
ncbi:hypothetical protein DPMN_076737 [Dreissena polymorpha]|uniref:Uncharacterized protein n=1 Tax=Dreissena polymorpha TaxID=45954 RepID=A0A9D3YP79_DREPO|nr:hypothetical protein DPMN_076737 [Dreissena polymorpha]